MPRRTRAVLERDEGEREALGSRRRPDFPELAVAVNRAGAFAPPSAASMMAVQRSVGNRAAQAMLSVQRDGEDEDINVRLAQMRAEFDTLNAGPEQAPAVPAPTSTLSKVRRAGMAAGRKATSKTAGATGIGALGIASAVPATRGGLTTAGEGLGRTMAGRSSTDIGAGQAVSSAGAGFGVATGGLGFGVGAGMLGYGLYSRDQETKKRNWAGARLGGRMAKSGGWLMAGGATGAALGGVELAALKRGSGQAGGLNQAADALMIAGGGVTAARGLWKLGKSVSRLRSLGQVNPVTDEGRMWLARAKNRAKNKAAVAGFKTVVGGLGAAGGGLLMADNPVGWAVSLGAAALGGIGTLIGLGNKARQSKADEADKKGDLDRKTRSARAAVKATETEALGKARTPEERKQVKQRSAEASAALHSNLQVGMAMHEALKDGNDRAAIPVWRAAEADEEAPFPKAAAKVKQAMPDRPVPELKDFQALDAVMICSAMNIERSEARSASGAELIQAKLAAADAG